MEGLDRDGVKFSEESRTVVINRNGARISLQRNVAAGTTLVVSTLAGRRSAKFRVVGPTQPPGSEGGEWGIECQEAGANIWGIGFPPSSAVEGACKALLECRRCHTVKLSQLSLIEHEVLSTSGLLVKECEACARMTAWSFREPSVPVPTDDSGNALPSPESAPTHQPAPNRRYHNRVALQLPIRVRSYYGAEEFARTENVSRSGMCFVTERSYEIGEVILVTCPFEKGGHNIEIRGQVVRRREMQGTGRKIYGVHYER